MSVLSSNSKQYKEPTCAISPTNHQCVGKETRQEQLEQDQGDQYEYSEFRNPWFRNFYHSLQQLHITAQEHTKTAQRIQERIVYRDKIVSRFNNIDYWRGIVRKAESRAKKHTSIKQVN